MILNFTMVSLCNLFDNTSYHTELVRQLTNTNYKSATIKLTCKIQTFSEADKQQLQIVRLGTLYLIIPPPRLDEYDISTENDDGSLFPKRLKPFDYDHGHH